jgi:hypothetical protein
MRYPYPGCDDGKEKECKRHRDVGVVVDVDKFPKMEGDNVTG